MKHLFIAGNWKSNKTAQEANAWIDTFSMESANNTVVLCAPYTLLGVLQYRIKEKKLPLFLAAQNVSAFPEGAYTGEVTARQVKEFADWVVIGHSERRKYFGETDEILATKTKLAHEAGLKVIYCVQDDTTVVPDGVEVVAYEPVWAIGTGKTDSPENANSVIKAIKEKTHTPICIYGGSVTPENVKSFVETEYIDGVLPGGASLDPQKFQNLISAAQ
jgi:triosephosphate isomerase